MKTYSARVMIKGHLSVVTVQARTIAEASRLLAAQYAHGRLVSTPVEVR